MEEIKKQSIKQWATDDRPREKLLTKGIAALSNAELITILLGTGSRDYSALQLAQQLLNQVNNNLSNLAKLSLTELQQIKGIGEAKATTIATAFELGRRKQSEQALESPKIIYSSQISNLMGPILNDLTHEEFWVIMLNRGNLLIGKEKISKGGITSTVTDVRLILKLAIDNLASSIILCHNHPSGNLNPSKEDIELTKKITEACKLVDIKVADHIIVSTSGYYSFTDKGLM